MKKREKTYLVINNKSNNVVIIVTSKTQAGKLVGLSFNTIKRHLAHSSIYDTNEFTIWKDVIMIKRHNYNRKDNLHPHL